MKTNPLAVLQMLEGKAVGSASIWADNLRAGAPVVVAERLGSDTILASDWGGLA